MSKNNASLHLRDMLAKEAARLIIENGIKDFGLAKRKAAKTLKIKDVCLLPRNSEIENNIIDRHMIFDEDSYLNNLNKMRNLALKIMNFFIEFSPRLVGPVFSGSATYNSPIEIHVFSDSLEDLIDILNKERIGFKNFQKRYQFHKKSKLIIPGFSFEVDNISINLMIFREKGEYNFPLSPIDKKPMKGITRNKLIKLLKEFSSGL